MGKKLNETNENTLGPKWHSQLADKGAEVVGVGCYKQKIKRIRELHASPVYPPQPCSLFAVWSLLVCRFLLITSDIEKMKSQEKRLPTTLVWVCYLLLNESPYRIQPGERSVWLRVVIRALPAFCNRDWPQSYFIPVAVGVRQHYSSLASVGDSDLKGSQRKGCQQGVNRWEATPTPAPAQSDLP